MDSIFQYINNSISRLASKELNPINQARIRMLVYTLFFYMIFAGVLIVAYFIDDKPLHLWRVSIIFTTCFLLFATVWYTNAWRLVSHIAICLITLSVWTNILIYVQGVSIVTVQYIWILTILSFYMLGLKWGWFYSAINMLPVFLLKVIEYSEYSYLIGSLELLYTRPPVRGSVYLFVLTYDFLIIVFLHYHFFKIFNLNIISLTNTKNELNDLNDKLNETLVDVKKLSNARMDFLSTMSHELRTPLNGVIGISNALTSQNPREDQKENLAILRFSAENLLALINDILDFNKSDSEKMELEHVPFNLAALIKSNCASLEMKAHEKKLYFKLNIAKEIEDKIVFSDPTRLTQVLLNLLSNAIKFTEKGSVSLNTYIVEENSDKMTVRFTIEDTGIGIEPSKQQYVFETFTQASPSTNRHHGGTGLGLPIVKKVLSMFASHIEMVSLPNRGTKIFFDIVFDYKIDDSNTQVESRDRKDELKNLRVLVAEDNAINILVIKKTLGQWGIVPDIAENGVIALQKLDSGTYDVVLMDLYMPEMDGYETTTSIRKMTDRAKADITIIALTATVNDDVIQKTVEVGMDAYLAKPFRPEDLFDKLHNLTLNKNI